ncbi:MAG TPA: protein kinase, partial [Streptosporangiaceae bacterium]|nr:protein kinase [Streptosporangiaceae bacterium]
MSEAIPPTFSEFAVGSLIAGYRLEEQIGHGGMAVVYRAYDARLDRRVALKILAPGLALDEAFRHRFIRESKTAAAVDHPHIIPVFDAGEASGVLFIAMRFVQGRDVGTLLHRTGSLAPARATEIIAQVASALDAAHARGLVHRDVKPANMLLDESTGSDRQDHVYLSDFGLSKQSLSQTGITSQGQVLGTLDYIAPEQIEGRPVDGRADLYALACAAFELISGAPPFKRSGGLAVVWAQLSEPPPPLTARRAGLPPAIDDVLARAMAKSPADRFRRCGEFAVALREVLGLRTAEPGGTGGRARPAPATQVAVLRADLPPGSPVPFTSPAGAAPPAGDAPPARDVVTARDALSFGDAVPVGEAVSAGDAAPPGDAGSAADTAPPFSLPLPWRAPSAGNALSAGDALSAGNGPSAGVAWAAGDAAAARDQAPPQGSQPAPAFDPYERLYSGRRYEAGPPAEAASGMPAAGSIRRGPTEPGGPPSGPRGYVGDGAPRPPSWRSRGALLAAAVVVVLGIVAGVVVSADGDGSGKMTNGLASKIPGLTSVPAPAPQLQGVGSQKVGLGGHPFGVAVTRDGQYSFVSLGNSVAVLSNDGGSLAPKQIATIPAPGAKKSEAITSSGQYLLAAAG